jgi:hypothetical protein
MSRCGTLVYQPIIVLEFKSNSLIILEVKNKFLFQYDGRRFLESLGVMFLLVMPHASCDSGYSPPSSYNSPSYDAPKHHHQDEVIHNHFHYYGLTPPPQKPSYEAPKPSYDAPVSSYGAPKPSYDAPKPSYDAPAPSYGAPAPSYGAPVPSYGVPSPAYGAPPPPGLYDAAYGPDYG